MIRCNLCGATTSTRGGPFSDRTLAQHLWKMHQATSNPTTAPVENNGLAAFHCDVCGATTSRRGRPFRSAGDVLRHKTLHDHGVRTAEAPGDNATRRRGSAVAHNVVSHRANFCPNCGFNLEVINAAIDLVNRP